MKIKSTLRSFLICCSSLPAAILFTQTAHAIDSTYTQASNGTWSGGPWTAGIPTAAGDIARITPNWSGGRTTTLDSARTIGTMTLGDTTAIFYRLDFRGSGTVAAPTLLTFDNLGSNALLSPISTVNGSSNLFRNTMAILLNDPLNIDNTSSDVLQLQCHVTANAAGTKTISNISTGTGAIQFDTSVIADGGGGKIAILQNSATSPMVLLGNNRRRIFFR